MNPTENAEWWKMTPNSFPNLACLDTITDGASVALAGHSSVVWTVVVSQFEAELNK